MINKESDKEPNGSSKSKGAKMKTRMMKTLASVLAVVIGLCSWIAVGSVGILLRYFTREEYWFTVGSWGGLFVCSYITTVIYSKLKKRWLISAQGQTGSK